MRSGNCLLVIPGRGETPGSLESILPVGVISAGQRPWIPAHALMRATGMTRINGKAAHLKVTARGRRLDGSSAKSAAAPIVLAVRVPRGQGPNNARRRRTLALAPDRRAEGPRSA